MRFKKIRILSLFLLRTTDWFLKKHGITFKGILSDNGKEFTTHYKKGRKRHPFERTLLKLDITHKYTRPYRPQTNGKVERFWRIWIDECWKRKQFSSWVDYDSNHKRFMYRYNHIRKHGGINYMPPVQKLNKIFGNFGFSIKPLWGIIPRWGYFPQIGYFHLKFRSYNFPR